jgi:hypothetical protein
MFFQDYWPNFAKDYKDNLSLFEKIFTVFDEEGGMKNLRNWAYPLIRLWN